MINLYLLTRLLKMKKPLLLTIALSFFGLIVFAQPCNLTLSAIGYNAFGGGANGAVTTSVSNGTSPYSYSWSTGQTTTSITNLLPGQYSVTVVDANGCAASSSATIINLAGPTVLNNSNVVSSYQTVNGGFTPQWVCPNDTLHSDGGIMRIYLESGATMITGGGKIGRAHV